MNRHATNPNVQVRFQNSGSDSGSSSVIFSSFIKDCSSDLRQSISRFVIEAVETAKKIIGETRDQKRPRKISTTVKSIRTLILTHPHVFCYNIYHEIVLFCPDYVLLHLTQVNLMPSRRTKHFLTISNRAQIFIFINEKRVLFVYNILFIISSKQK